MRNNKIKQFVLLLGLMLPMAWCGASGTNFIDGYSHINVKEANVSSSPKGHTIKASIDGHTLTVFFTENIGSVEMEITTVAGAHVQTYWANTPDGFQTNIPNVGNYVITITLSNGDEYYGEFTVTD